MQIRRKLTYRFISIVALILLFSSISIYISSATYREDDFYNRLASKGRNTAKLLIEVEGVDADLLHRIEEDNPMSLPDEKIVIYNYKNELLFSTGDLNELEISDELLDEVRLEEEIRYVENGQEVIGFLFTDTYDRFVVIAAAKDIYGLKKLANLRIILLLVFGSSIIVVLIAGWIYAGRALSPISKVVDQVNNISISSLNLRLDEGKNKDEIDQLAGTFNKMLHRLEKAFMMQKNFIANASHELRTPLTAITGQLEVVLMQDREADKYRETMESVLEDMKKLNIISNRLLLLAQASSESSKMDFKPLRIDDILWQVQQELVKHRPGYKINVVFDENFEEEEHLIIFGNEQLIKTALTNLVENACKYSHDHTAEILIKSGPTRLMIEFRDQGIGIEPEDLKDIFQPFHRGKNAHSYSGHGIGLSLVERIVALHDGKISVESTPGKGSVFTMSLPYYQS